jgi:hypothetical protein
MSAIHKCLTATSIVKSSKSLGLTFTCLVLRAENIAHTVIAVLLLLSLNG